MVSQLDKAKELETLHREQSLQAQKANRLPEPAQQRDDDGNIICISCGFEVGEKRLAHRPESARCIGCQTDEEFKHGRGR